MNEKTTKIFEDTRNLIFQMALNGQMEEKEALNRLDYLRKTKQEITKIERDIKLLYYGTITYTFIMSTIAAIALWGALS